MFVLSPTDDKETQYQKKKRNLIFNEQRMRMAFLPRIDIINPLKKP
jgi:hypothetical protein